MMDDVVFVRILIVIQISIMIEHRQSIKHKTKTKTKPQSKARNRMKHTGFVVAAVVGAVVTATLTSTSSVAAFSSHTSTISSSSSSSSSSPYLCRYPKSTSSEFSLNLATQRETDNDISSSTNASSLTTTTEKSNPSQLSSWLSTLRLSGLLLLFPITTIATSFVAIPAPAVAAATTTTTTIVSSSSSVIVANIDNTNYDEQGISAITKSALGTSVRTGVVQSAKLVDNIDLKWERFSDSLRDKQKCDPVTNRRLFDNGFRNDGTPRGNPVLGALCTPVPLKEIDNSVVTNVLNEFENAAYEIISGGDITGTTTNTMKIMDRSELKGIVDQTRQKLEPAFNRAMTTTTTTTTSDDEKTPSSATSRQQYNLEVYSRVRAYSDALGKSLTSTSSTATTSESKSSYKVARETGKKLDLIWGRNLLNSLAGPSTTKYDFQTPFPKPVNFNGNIPLPYDENKLMNSLGALESALQKLQDGGLIGHWEISIPEDDYGEVVTIAVDDDVCLGAQILAREDSTTTKTMQLTGSPVVAMVRSAIEERAKIPYVALDVFFIDPTTTKNELYNPTQLLISIRNLGEEP
jgi:hypothetical protein